MKQNQSETGLNSITFESFDRLNLKSFGESLFQVIEKGLSPSSVGELGEKRGWTISLNGAFGNGKTTFLKMFEEFIKTKKQDYDVIFINAWESDFYKEPVIAVLSALAQETGKKQAEIQKMEKSQEKSRSENLISAKLSIEDIKKAGYGITRAVGSFASQLIQHKTGVDLQKITESYCIGVKRYSQKKEQALGKDILKSFERRKKVVRQMREAVAEYIKAAGKKLLIIVDELDRARPDYAVHFLEDMKHFFDIEDAAFLVAVNREQMEAAVKCLYGQDLKFNGYYRKFFKQEMDLPDPYKEAEKFVDALVRKTKVQFYQKNNDGETDLIARGMRVKNAYLSCKIFGLTLREIENFIRIFEMILGHEINIPKWIYMDAYSFFICLFLKEKEIFQKILDSQYTLDDFLKFASKKKGLDNSENYLLNYLLGQTACSFIQRKSDKLTHDGQIKIQILQKDKILHVFPEIKRDIDTLTSRMEGFIWDYDPPALGICEKISRCHPAFSQ